jgi:hypothetical protein
MLTDMHQQRTVCAMNIGMLWKQPQYKTIQTCWVCVDKSDHMTNTYSVCRWTWKWMKMLFFHVLDLSITNTRCPCCNVGLCSSPCFMVYHVKLHSWILSNITLE